MSKLSIGLTGGIGVGKTLVCNVFSHLGIPVFNSDNQAKECYTNSDFLLEIKKEFGVKVVRGDELVKKELAKIVFNDKEKLLKLNSMIHPYVLKKYLNWKELQESSYVIHENAILLEIGWKKYFDKIVCIYSPEEIALERVIGRDGANREEILARMNNQYDNKLKMEMSDYVINHDNDKLILPQILDIHTKILNII